MCFKPVATSCPVCFRRLKDTVHIAQTIAATIGAESDSPFEFRVLEALLAETAHHFEGKSRYGSWAITILRSLRICPCHREAFIAACECVSAMFAVLPI